MNWTLKVQPELVPVAAFLVVFVSKALVAILVAAWPTITNPPAMKDVLKVAEAVKELKSSYDSLNKPETFEQAMVVKKRLEIEEAKLRRARQKSMGLNQSHNHTFLLSLFEVLGPAFAVIFWWTTPVFRIEGLTGAESEVQMRQAAIVRMLSPLMPLLAFPNHPYGSLGIIPWVFICQRACDFLIGAFTAGIALTNSLTAPAKSVSIKESIAKME